MTQTIKPESSVLAIIKNSEKYLDARKQIEWIAQEHGLRVADMPLIIQALTSHPEVRKAVRPEYLDSSTTEYYGQRDGKRSYEAGHGAGSLATPKGLQAAFEREFEKTLKNDPGNLRNDHRFITIDDDEWAAIGNGEYLGKDVPRVHLDDARKGDVPAAGTPYTIFTNPDRDRPTIAKGNLEYDAFMRDDRILMLTGSPDGREALAGMLFGAKKDGGEGWKANKIHHYMDDANFDTPSGRLLRLRVGNNGLNSQGFTDKYGRFLAVSDEMAEGSSVGDFTLETLVYHKELNDKRKKTSGITIGTRQGTALDSNVNSYT